MYDNTFVTSTKHTMIQKSARHRVIVAALEIIQSGFTVKDIAAIAQRLKTSILVVSVIVFSLYP